jgi:hypothetical protein
MSANNKTPIRGTQSFVAIMGQVWPRPSLALLEITWRWLPFIALLIITAITGLILGSSGVDIHLTGWSAIDTASLQQLTVFKPVIAINTLSALITAQLAPVIPLLRWLIPTLLFLWLIIAALGRTLVLRRLDPTLHARRRTVFALSTLRALFLAGAWYLWLRLVAYATRITITAPAARHDDPSLVLFSAMLICGTIILYVLWGIFSWFLYLAPLLAMQRNLGVFASLRAAIASRRDLRSKLIEINLVMNIVRIALIVLAMVLSASPLAFQTVATQEFFAIWWGIAVLLYLAASDYFHVVRSAAYLSLYRAYNFPQLNSQAPS